MEGNEDRSIVDEKGEVIFLRADGYRDDICLGDCCFRTAGAQPDESRTTTTQSTESAVRRYDLFAGGRSAFPNRSAVSVPSVRCSMLCRVRLADGEASSKGRFSQVIRSSIISTNEYLSKGSRLKMFVSIGLIV